MANAFNLTAQLQLQAPKNTSQVANQISRDLNGITVDVQVKANPRQMAAANSQMQNLSKASSNAANNMGNLNRSLSEAARRFSVITIATGSMLALARSIKNAFGEAIEFERQLIKIEQVTGKNVKQLSGLTKEITKLSTSLGASSKDLLGISRILTQAGFEINKVKSALDILAKTTLGATFEDIEDTTEGAVAVLRQFGEEARKTGGDIKFLQQTMDAINSVSKNFAVESGDLITVIRRVGGVFESAGGSVNELIALFTSVRATTRETAETIATGLRTIFTRIQRTDTVDQLEALGIQLRDSRGQFVGAYEAVRRLSTGLSALDPKDFRFSEIVESLGGFRQIGKVIPLIKQFTTAQDALRVAQNSGGSVARDAATAQQSLAVQFERTREKFDALVRKLADSSSFQTLTRGVLKLADAFIKIVDALEPLLPMLLPLLGLKLGKALAPGIGALSGASRFAQGRNQGGPIRKFANGGLVPGVGNGDTVSAMVEPGEYVIKKSSVKKFGVDNLQRLNTGGKVSDFRSSFARKNIYRGKVKLKKDIGPFEEGVNAFNMRDEVTSNVRRNQKQDVTKNIKKAAKNMGETQIGLARKFNNLRNNASRQGNLFEDILVGAGTLSQSGGKYGANQPLDGVINGNRLAEVKRTKVSEKQLLDKRLRHEFAQNKLKNVKLSSGKDTIKLSGVTELTPDRKSYTSKELKQEFARSKGQVKRRAAQTAALGGRIQKFAAGGAVKSILEQNKVGAVNLDVGKDNDVKLGVTLSQVNATQTAQKNNALKNKAGVRKYLKSKGKSAPPSYTLKRKSLDETTGDKFRKVVVDELVKGVDGASNRLGQDLIGQPVQATDDAKKAVIKNFNKQGGAIALAYEDVLNVVANKGNYAPADLFQPFDFPNGLEPPLVDNFKGVPNAFVDARKAQTSKDKQAFERKIANQIALEADASEFGKLPGREQRAALGGMIKKFADGGSSKDTVPALLTPGEFVFNKKAADRIGPAKLNAMNKRGEVQGFNKGGAVGRIPRFNSGGGVQKFGVGGRVSSGEFGLTSVKDITLVNVAAQKNARAFDQLTQDIQSLDPSAQRAALVTFARNIEVVSDESALLAKSMDSADSEMTKVGDRSEQLAKRLEQQAASAARKNQGQAENRGGVTIGGTTFGAQPATLASYTGGQGRKLSGDELADITKSLDQVAARKGGGLSASERNEAANKGLKKYQMLILKGINPQQAFNESVIAMNEALGKSKEAFEESTDAVERSSEKTRGTSLESTKSEIGSIRNIASSAQQFVFLGGTAAALASQFTGMSEATKRATTQTIGYATALVGGIGTIVELGASVAESIVVRKLEAQASRELIKVNLERAAIEKGSALTAKERDRILGKSTSSLSKFVSAAGVATLAIVGVSTAFKFITSKLQAEAEEIGKASDAIMERLRKGDQGAIADYATNSNQRIQAENQLKAAKAAGDFSVAATAAVVGLGVLAVVLTPITAGVITLTALVTLVIGAFSAIDIYTKEIDRSTKAAQVQREAVEASSRSLAELVQGQAEYLQTLKDLESLRGLDIKELLEKRLGAADKNDITGQGFESFRKRSDFLEQQAIFRNKNVADLTEGDFNDPSTRIIFKEAVREVEEFTQSLKSSSKAAQDTLEQARKLALKEGITDFDEANKQGSLFNRALEDVLNIKETQSAIKIIANNQRLATLENRALDPRLSPKGREEIGAQIEKITIENNDLENRIRQDRADIIRSEKNVFKSGADALAAQKAAALAAEKAALKLEAVADFGNALDVLGQQLDKRGRQTSDLASIASGGVQDFSFDEILGLKDLKRTGNRSKFSKDLKQITKFLPKDMQAQAKTMVKSVELGASLLQEGQIAVSKLNFDNLGQDVGKEQFDQVLEAANIDIDQAKADDFYDDMFNKFRTSFEDGISEKEFREIFKPYLDEADAAAKEFEKANQLRNKDIQGFEKYVDAIAEIRNREIQARELSIQTTQKADDFRRRARGLEQTATSKRSDSLALSRNRLGGIGGSLAGRAQAGNLSSIIGTREQAQRLFEQSVNRVNSQTLTLPQRKEELKKQKELQNAIKITTEELGHFAEMTEDAVEATMERIEQEKASREVQKGIVEEAVVGGPEQRNNLARTLFNVQKAFATGTLQNQSPADRNSTVSMLDRLENVFLPGAGMTGGDLKELLIRQDARRMGLSEEAAMAIFDQSSVEKQLINSIDRLANVMDQVAAAQAQNANFGGGQTFLQTMAGIFGFANGGKVPVYRNEGGSIFQPKGTDTVPAMLTPGEFVVRKSAVDKVGVGTLNAINQGKASYFNKGGSVGKIKLNPYDEGEKDKPDFSSSADKRLSDANYKSATAFNKEYEFYNRPDTDEEIKRKNNSFRNTLGSNKSPELNFLLDVVAAPISIAEQWGDPSFLESPEKRASRLFGSPEKGDFDRIKRESDEAQNAVSQIKDNRREFNELDYANQILAAGGGNKRPSEVGKLFKSDKVFEGGLKDILSSGQTGVGGALLGLINADFPDRPDVSDEAFNNAWTLDTANDRKYLQNELNELNAMYKANGEYRGINFSARIRDDVRAKRYNDIRSSIENKIKKLTKILDYDQGEKDKAKRLVDAKETAKARGVTLEQYYQQERDRVALENAGYSAEDASNFAGIGDPDYVRGQAIFDDVFKSNIHYARLWKDSTGQPYDSPYDNSGYADAVRMAMQVAREKWDENAEFGGRTYADDSKFRSPGGETKNLGGDAVMWADAPFNRKLAAAMDEMHTIGSLRRAKGEDYEPKPYHRGIEDPNSLQDFRDLKNKRLGDLDKEMERSQRSLDEVNRIPEQEAAVKKFMGDASSVAKNAVSGFASFMNVGADQAKKIDAGRVKASKMFSDLKAKGMSAKKAMGETMASLRSDGYTIDEIESMIQRPAGPMTKTAQENFDAANLERVKMMIDDSELFDTDQPLSEYGRQVAKNKKRESEARDLEARNAGFMTQAAGNLSLSYEPGPVKGETPEEKSKRIRNNKKIREEYHRLRKQERMKEENQEREKTQADAKAQVNSSNVINGTNAGGSGGFGGSGTAVGNMLTGLGKMLGGGAADPAAAAGDGPLAGMTAESVAINKDDLSFKQKKNLQRNNINLGFVNEKRAAMLKLYQEGWATKDDEAKKKALYAIDSGYRKAAGTRSENWYLGVANQQILSFGKYLEAQQAAQGFATGGSINGGMDSVPAMLTPGEFVMSREAVAKHGVGYMKNLNMGKATGFRRGGVVGTGNVQYKANGGSVGDGGGMMIDPSLLSGVLDTFSQNFSASIDRIAGPMANLAASLENIANAFSGLTMTHVFSGEIGLAVNVSNKDAIIAAVSEGITPMISQLITRQLNAQENNFKAGG